MFANRIGSSVIGREAAYVRLEFVAGGQLGSRLNAERNVCQR